ncbi:Uncharacterized protein TCM_007480 [Theobroma cacao]|uniref:Uncharacterized protein n=1 Tax=Theobroma cacao TaxID=3641 RepID=A0A061E371_THECC|nr:Uncharacterized protein TCM_007480 [Theobroma cacao]
MVMQGMPKFAEKLYAIPTMKKVILSIFGLYLHKLLALGNLKETARTLIKHEIGNGLFFWYDGGYLLALSLLMAEIQQMCSPISICSADEIVVWQAAKSGMSKASDTCGAVHAENASKLWADLKEQFA